MNQGGKYDLSNICIFRTVLKGGGIAIQSLKHKATVEISTELFSNDFVVVTIKDYGEGIDKKDMDKIFDPFFTTKRSKGGTGLGLAISAEIIKQHHGTIDIESNVGEGTTVRINLPGSHISNGE